MENEKIHNDKLAALMHSWANNKEEVPMGYFENAPQNVLNQIAAKKKKKQSIIYTLTRLSIAAVVIAIITNVYFLNNTRSIEMKDITTEELEAYITKNDIDFIGVDNTNASEEIAEYFNESKDSLTN